MVDRPVLEAFIAWVNRQRNERRRGVNPGQPIGASSRVRILSTVSMFLEAWRRDVWEPELPGSARIYADEYPRTPGLKANFIDEFLMAQIESEANLALLDPETRAVVLICRDEGLRIGEALTLKVDCLKQVRRAGGCQDIQERRRPCHRDGDLVADGDAGRRATAWP